MSPLTYTYARSDLGDLAVVETLVGSDGRTYTIVCTAASATVVVTPDGEHHDLGLGADWPTGLAFLGAVLATFR